MSDLVERLTRERDATPPMASEPEPVAVVTDEMVEAAEAAIYPRHERGFLLKPLVDPIDMRAALEAVVPAALLAAEQRGRDAEREWHGMETAPRDGTHILVDLGPGTPPTTVHWFADDPALGGAGNAGWYISVQQNDGPAVNPVAWQHLPIAAA